MQTIFAWILVVLVIAAAYPWANWLLRQAPHPSGFLLTALLTLPLSIGILTLLMFWEGLLRVSFSVWAITLPYFALMLPGWWLWRRGDIPILDRNPGDTNQSSPVIRRLSACLLLISIAILFNAVYWPFSKDDAVAIYHRYGQLMYETGRLVPFAGRDDAFYQAYPAQMSLAYTYTYLASGWPNEYLARLIPALFSLGCLGAVYVLGNMVYGAPSGWLSAFLLAFMPIFARWASSGYVDLPMAFCYTVAAIFAWRLWSKQNALDGLLTGVMLGLAAWTKNAALLAIAFMSLWLIYGWLRGNIRLKWLLVVWAICALIAAPWYLRNWLEAGLIVPPTAWTDQAQHTLKNLLVFAVEPENFALTGWLILISLTAIGIRFARRKSIAAGDAFLLVLALPFFVAWWILVSYDPRFLLLFLPLLTVLAGGWLVQCWQSVPHQWHKVRTVLTIIIAVMLTGYILWISVEFKADILHHPFMSDADKHAIVSGSKP
jgi:4-amino-4-deoxy-L-arabinose transferase-like glycosyltransferase